MATTQTDTLDDIIKALEDLRIALVNYRDQTPPLPAVPTEVDPMAKTRLLVDKMLADSMRRRYEKRIDEYARTGIMPEDA